MPPSSATSEVGPYTRKVEAWPSEYAEHDVSGEQRDPAGKWTAGGGSAVGASALKHREALAGKYRAEYGSGKVDIQRLHHEAAKEHPGLTADQFKGHLEGLEKAGHISLHKDPEDKGFDRYGAAGTIYRGKDRLTHVGPAPQEKTTGQAPEAAPAKPATSSAPKAPAAAKPAAPDRPRKSPQESAKDFASGSPGEAPIAGQQKPPANPEEAITQSWERRKLYKENQDGLVPIPEIMHELKAAYPGAKSEDLKKHILKMWDDKKAEPHILNEEYKVKPEQAALGIRHNDKLYYYLMMKPKRSDHAERPAARTGKELPARSDAPSGKLGTASAVPLFLAGEHGPGEVYTDDDLRDMVRNFYLNRGKLDPPAAIGHEDEQSLLDNTGLPAVGWPKRVWVAKPNAETPLTFFADIEDIPEPIGRLINARAYKKVSAEVYGEPPRGCAGKGKTFRRVAFLGGELPRIKTLGDLPHVRFSERIAAQIRPTRLVSVPGRRLPDGAYAIYSEVRPMPTTHGGTHRHSFSDGSTFHGGTHTHVHGKGQTFGEEEPPVMPAKREDVLEPPPKEEDLRREAEDPPAPMGGADGTGGGSREDMISALQQQHGADPSVITPEVPDAVLAEWLRTLKQKDSPDVGQHAEGQQHCSYDENGDPIPGPKGEKDGVPLPPDKLIPGPKSYSEKAVQNLVRQAVREAIPEIQSAKRQAQAALNDATHTRVLTFCERMRLEGRLLPAEIEAGKVESLLAMDNTTLRKFSEKAAACTALENEMRIIQARPRLVKFSEVARQGPITDPKADPDVEKVERFAEMHAEAFAKTASDPKKFVETFKKKRATDPSYTAAKYLGE